METTSDKYKTSSLVRFMKDSWQFVYKQEFAFSYRDNSVTLHLIALSYTMEEISWGVGALHFRAER